MTVTNEMDMLLMETKMMF